MTIEVKSAKFGGVRSVNYVKNGLATVVNSRSAIVVNIRWCVAKLTNCISVKLSPNFLLKYDVWVACPQQLRNAWADYHLIQHPSLAPWGYREVIDLHERPVPSRKL